MMPIRVCLPQMMVYQQCYKEISLSHAYCLNLGSSGRDALHGFLIFKLAAPLSILLTLIFHFSFLTSSIPDIWCKAIIVPPIFKKGSKSDPLNYRPVSLTCVVAKLLRGQFLFLFNAF